MSYDISFDTLYDGLPVGTYYYTHDHLGSGSLITDASGNEYLRVVYDEYGNIDQYRSGIFDLQTGTVLPAADDIAKLFLAVKFTGQEYDPETGLYYYNARYYDPALGLFTTPDIYIDGADTTAGYNRYSYVQGNPLKYTDPSGHFAFIVIAVVAGAILGGTKGNPFNSKNWKNFNSTGAVIGAIAGGTGAWVGGLVAGVTTGLGGAMAAGAASGATAGFINGTGNALLNGVAPVDAIFTGLYGAGVGALAGAAIGGIFYGANELFGTTNPNSTASISRPKGYSYLPDNPIPDSVPVNPVTTVTDVPVLPPTSALPTFTPIVPMGLSDATSAAAGTLFVQNYNRANIHRDYMSIGNGGGMGSGGGGSTGRPYLLNPPSAQNIFQQMGPFSGKNIGQTNKILRQHGFKLHGRTSGGYIRYKGLDGAEVWIRPNGEVLRLRQTPG